MATTASPSSLEQCEYCGKKSSASLKIRACTRCYSVGYCSKECQRADWLPSKTKNNDGNGSQNEQRKGHKSRCVPMPKPSTSSKSEDDTGNIGLSATTKTETDSNVVRLEMRRPDASGNEDDDTVWENVGPIHLIDNLEEAKTKPQSINQIHAGNTEALKNVMAGKNNHNASHQKNGKSKSCHLKNLPKRTQKMLGPMNKNNATTYKYRHSSDGVDENLLIFFHGAGDSHLPYDNLGQKMELPQTATLSLSASMSITSRSGNLSAPSSTTSSSFVELPFGLGYTWFEEMDYELTGMTLRSDHPRRLKSLRNAMESIDSLLCSLTGINLASEDEDTANSWIPERIFLFGFSVGACLVMEVCRLWQVKGRMPLGGGICIAGGIKTEVPPLLRKCDVSEGAIEQQPTDVLIITGTNDTEYPQKAAMDSKEFYVRSNTEIHVQKGKGHEMIKSNEEMQKIMEFLSKRLVRRMLSMEGLGGMSK